jgi:hypothetical protein
MKQLFDEHDHWTHDANNLDNRFRRAIDPIVKEMAEEGYSLRQIGYVLFTLACDVIQTAVINAQIARVRKTRKDKG